MINQWFCFVLVGSWHNIICYYCRNLGYFMISMRISKGKNRVLWLLVICDQRYWRTAIIYQNCLKLFVFTNPLLLHLKVGLTHPILLIPWSQCYSGFVVLTNMLCDYFCSNFLQMNLSKVIFPTMKQMQFHHLILQLWMQSCR